MSLVAEGARFFSLNDYSGGMDRPQWTVSGSGRAWVTRLLPGMDLRDEVEAWAKAHNISAACVLSAVGSLSIASIRFAGTSRPWNEGRDWEVISLQGTVSSTGVHLHLSVADDQGKTFGGHLVKGCTIRTTMELCLMELNDCTFSRTQDPTTGFSELTIIPE